MGSRRSTGVNSNYNHLRRLRNVVVHFFIVLLVFVVLVGCDNGSSSDEDNRELNINLDAANVTARLLGDYLVGLATALTGAGFMEEYFHHPDSRMTVERRNQLDMPTLLDRVRNDMKSILDEKESAVRELKKAAEEGMQRYGPYKDYLKYEEVKYFNAKKVVIEADIMDMDNDTQEKIKDTIDFLPTTYEWGNGLSLNLNTSTVHVPTNIYDKSTRILNGVRWTENLTQQFQANSQTYPSLAWQYFCSSDGFFRIYPGMQWPRDPDKVDIFDCRMQKWYIQAASTPKNIVILLDTSGSMMGKRMAIAQSTVSTILDTLSDEDYFNIIKYSKEPEYIDPCFNGTMMPANVDNIRRIQEKVKYVSTKDSANLNKALILAFQLLKQEETTVNTCNKAIMIVTDGASENYVDVYKEFNWPQKAVRIFTYLIGKEVPEDRKVQWMACVNKGEFSHISTRADVQENVQQYIKVLSRPMAQNKSTHGVWSAIYLDYPTGQSEIKPYQLSYISNRIEAEYEDKVSFQGLGLIISFAVPVFDLRTRDKVAKNEENPEKNLLGVVGTDLRVNDLVRLIPTYKLGVNGYAFAVTNHGYVLFHPDFRPFHMRRNHLSLRPKYNSVDLSEVELPFDDTGQNGHPLRRYLLMAQEGSSNMSSQTVLTHLDGMKRAKFQSNVYHFTAVANKFRLVFVLPARYGNNVLKLGNISDEELKKDFRYVDNTDSTSNVVFAAWIYCKDKAGMHVPVNDQVIQYFLFTPKQKELDCDRDHLRHLLLDARLTFNYSQVWNGSSFKSDLKNRISEEHRNECLTRSGLDTQHCMLSIYQRYGIDLVWVGTSSGLTRYAFTNKTPEYVEFDIRYSAAIKSLYYRRAVHGWDEGFRYIFFLDGTRISKDKDKDSRYLVMAKAEIAKGQNDLETPIAVTAFRMNRRKLLELFHNVTEPCPSGYKCQVTCGNNMMMNCYLIDNNGYIMASNNPDNETSEFLGKHDPALMKLLVDQHVFAKLHVTDYQGICQIEVSNRDSSSSSLLTPFKYIARWLVWMFTEMAIFLSEWSAHSWFHFRFSSAQDGADPDSDDECGDEFPDADAVARYYLCNIVVHEGSQQHPQRKYVVDNRACVKNVTRYALNTTTMAKKHLYGSLSKCGSCNASKLVSYTVHWIQETNLIMVMAAAGCSCETNDTSKFVTEPLEVLYNEEEKCQRVRSFSLELKRVDNSRSKDTVCLDSRNESDYTCGYTSTHSSYLVLHLLLVATAIVFPACTC